MNTSFIKANLQKCVPIVALGAFRTCFFFEMEPTLLAMATDSARFSAPAIIGAFTCYVNCDVRAVNSNRSREFWLVVRGDAISSPIIIARWNFLPVPVIDFFGCTIRALNSVNSLLSMIRERRRTLNYSNQ